MDKVIQGLGFDAEDAKTRPVAGLSGGERGRVGLAAQLAAPADLVLLDEPTNHLDLETIDWLKQYLGEFGETVMVISHDRAFLDDTVDHVLHVSARTATAYRGGYSAFVTQRAERELAQARAVAQQRRVIAKEEDYIRRNIAGPDERPGQGAPRPAGAAAPALAAAGRGRGDGAPARGRGAGRRSGAGGRSSHRRRSASGCWSENFSSVARRGDVIALVGPNGAGKTTLLATLLGAPPRRRGRGQDWAARSPPSGSGRTWPRCRRTARSTIASPTSGPSGDGADPESSGLLGFSEIVLAVGGVWYFYVSYFIITYCFRGIPGHSHYGRNFPNGVAPVEIITLFPFPEV